MNEALTREQVEKQSWNLGQYIGCPESIVKQLLDEIESFRTLTDSLTDGIRRENKEVQSLRAQLTACENKLKTYSDWDNDADECYVPGHTQLQQQLTALTTRCTEMEKHLKGRRLTIEASIAAETLAANGSKLAMEQAALVEISEMEKRLLTPPPAAQTGA